MKRWIEDDVSERGSVRSSKSNEIVDRAIQSVHGMVRTIFTQRD